MLNDFGFGRGGWGVLREEETNYQAILSLEEKNIKTNKVLCRYKQRELVRNVTVKRVIDGNTVHGVLLSD